MTLTTSVPNTLKATDCALHLAYFIGQVELVVDMVDDTIRRVGILYDYSENTLTLRYDYTELYPNEYQELMVVDLALLLDFNVKMLAARMYGCYVANNRQVAYSQAPTMVVDYRHDR